MKNGKVIGEFEKFLYRDLSENHELTRAFLNEALKDDESLSAKEAYSVLLLCLHDVIEAYGGREEMSRKSGIPVEKLNHIFDEKEPIDEQIFAAIIDTFGWSLSAHEPHIVPRRVEIAERLSCDLPLLAAFNK